MRGLKLSNLERAIVVAAVLILGPASSSAVDRYGYIGFSTGPTLHVHPQTQAGDYSFSTDFAYFFEERWAGVLSIDYGLNQTRRVDLRIGPQLFLLLDGDVLPYLSADFLYSLTPEKAFGWRFNFGGEWNLARWTGLDNLRVVFESGISQLFIETPSDILILDIFRVGLSWNL